MQCWSEWSQNTPEPLWGTLCATVWSEWSQNTPEPRLGTLCVTVKSESWVLRPAREWRVRIFVFAHKLCVFSIFLGLSFPIR